ncbi:MAG: ATP-binding cassette domain-containing protein [Muribaculaceae bacterium]|nr:ATP-binding cassette domain-containing protein [Muribaculaceae bacterium]
MTKTVTERLTSIRLHNVIPDVFSNEDIGCSQIWLNDFCFERGRHYMVEAASGSGKSSLCSFIYHNRDDYRGSIYYNDTDARKLNSAEVCDLRCRRIALLPQELRLFGELNAIDNIKLKNRLTGYMSERKIEEMFERLGIADRINHLASRLSIGQMQRVAIIRALCQPFDFILLDEPVSHLDEVNNKVVGQLIYDAAQNQGASIIITSVGNRLILPTDDVINVKL